MNYPTNVRRFTDNVYLYVAMKDEYKKADPVVIMVGAVVLIAIVAVTIIITGVFN